MSLPASSSNPAAAIAGSAGHSHAAADVHVHDSQPHLCPAAAAAHPPAAPVAAGPHPAAPAIGPAPVARLYRHALESIFTFLDLRGLAAALRVSRGWLAPAQSMRALQLSDFIPCTVPLSAVTHSAMARHIVELGIHVGSNLVVDSEALQSLSLRMAHLRRLVCRLTLPQSAVGAALAFPVALRQLEVELPDDAGAAHVHAILRAINCLPLLEEFIIDLHCDPQISFAPLAAMSHLQVVCLFWNAKFARTSDAQVDELRALPWLRVLDVRPMTIGLLRRLLRRLLRQPHELQWQEIQLPPLLDDESVALLPQLPSLTKLYNARTRCTRFEWLCDLPNLTHVSLEQTSPATTGRVESLLAGLQHCTGITHLFLDNFEELTAAHLAQLLPRLPRLHELELGHLAVDSLSFLAQAPMTLQLTKLLLWHCKRLPLAELRHVHALRCLQSLTLRSSFDAAMDAQTRAQYRPPSRILPQLESFDYSWWL